MHVYPHTCLHKCNHTHAYHTHTMNMEKYKKAVNTRFLQQTLVESVLFLKCFPISLNHSTGVALNYSRGKIITFLAGSV